MFSEEDETEQRVNVSRFYKHPKADAAILRLKTKVKLNKAVDLIYLSQAMPRAYSTGTVSGWGRTVGKGSSTVYNVLPACMFNHQMVINCLKYHVNLKWGCW